MKAGRTQVVALPRGGAPRLLDAAPAGGGIDGTVLAAHNGRLFWLHDGASPQRRPLTRRRDARVGLGLDIRHDCLVS